MRIDRYKIDIDLAKSGMSGYKEFAKKIGLPARTLSVILSRGSCKNVNVGKIAKGLGVSVEKIAKKESGNDEN